MENVPEVVGSGNIADFTKWEQKLASLGYKNYVEILNAKNYGIPQNRRRCFMVSVLGDYAYNFPIKLKREYRLKDLLEKIVDKKYYLTNEHIERISNWKAQQKPLEHTLNPEESTSPTLTARGAGEEHSGMVLITEVNEKNDGGGLSIMENTKKGYKIAHSGDGVDISSRMKNHRGTVQKDMSQTLTCQCDVGVVIDEEKS